MIAETHAILGEDGQAGRIPAARPGTKCAHDLQAPIRFRPRPQAMVEVVLSRIRPARSLPWPSS